MEEPATWATADIRLAGWLVSLGIRPTAIPDRKANKVRFEFEHTPELGQRVADYLRGDARVNPATYHLVMDEVHGMIRDVQGGRR